MKCGNKKQLQPNQNKDFVMRKGEAQVYPWAKRNGNNNSNNNNKHWNRHLLSKSNHLSPPGKL